MTQAEILNRASADEARQRLFHCCGSKQWVDAMVSERPFASDEVLALVATRCFALMREADWLEAFAHHPKIGDLESLRKRFKDTAHLAGAEQSGAASASEATLKALARGNEEYEARFGFIFIVFATGKTADEMLAIMQARLRNPRDEELKNAATEQAKITMQRLTKIGVP